MGMRSASPGFSHKIVNKNTLAGVLGIVASATILTLGAGEDLIVGDPVYVSANLLYKADNVTNSRVIGVITVAALTGFLATVTISGKITLSGLTDATPYFLGNKVLTSTVPSSGKVIRMGTSISTTGFILNIEEPILLT